jgi:hypothetical protein
MRTEATAVVLLGGAFLLGLYPSRSEAVNTLCRTNSAVQRMEFKADMCETNITHNGNSPETNLVLGEDAGVTAPAATPVLRSASYRGYVGLSLDYATMSIDQQGVTSSHLGDPTYSIFGGTRLIRFLSIEYGYAPLGSYSADYAINTGSFNISEHHEVKFQRSLFASAVGWLPASVRWLRWLHLKNPDQFQLYGRIGVSYWHAKVEMSGQTLESGVLVNSYSGHGDGNGVSPFVGLGLHYRFAGDTALHFDWTGYDGVGKGVKVKLSDGTEQDFGGRSLSVFGLSLVRWY